MNKENTKYPGAADAARVKEVESEVGYGKPPVESRFKPGQSGNPGGRPRGSKNKRPEPREEPLKKLILQEAYRDISINDGTQNISMPMAQAVFRSISVKAGKGDHRSQKLFTKLVSSVEAEAKAQDSAWLETMITYKVEGERELERRKRLGIDGPEIIPHPDDIYIDFANNTATVLGPFTNQEKDQMDVLRAANVDAIERSEKLKAEIEAETSETRKAKLRKKLHRMESAMKKINKATGLE